MTAKLGTTGKMADGTGWLEAYCNVDSKPLKSQWSILAQEVSRDCALRINFVRYVRLRLSEVVDK